MRRDLLFETDRFNLSEVGPHFINPCCFGEDLAAWLRSQLTDRGVPASEPGQEDWGWYLGATYRGRTYLVGVGGNAEPASTSSSRGSNWGEWRVIVEPHLTIWERLKSMAGSPPKDAGDPGLETIVREILESQPDFSDVREDAGAP